ncbi:mutator type transposase [Tanacetum coccineum]|uniref:Mutator type transposase n=1 Tax=Tanacetum coccineum TaxID=301880 RepID=A0ABQ5DIS7_9ASTR
MLTPVLKIVTSEDYAVSNKTNHLKHEAYKIEACPIMRDAAKNAVVQPYLIRKTHGKTSTNTELSNVLNEELSDCETDLYNYKRGLSQVEARLVEFKNNEIKFCERIRVLERDLELRDNKIENLRNELEEVKKEKESIDFKIEKFDNASKDLDCLLGTQRSVKDKTGMGLNEYTNVPPPPAQVYSPPKNDLSWTGLPEFVDDTVTDYSRPTPSIDVPRDFMIKRMILIRINIGAVENVWSKHNQATMIYGGLWIPQLVSEPGVALDLGLQTSSIVEVYAQKKRTIRALQAELQQKYELGVSRQKAFRAKAAALNQVKGDYSQQYTMLRDYCLELRRANPDTTIKIEVERDSVSDLNTRMFKRIYICLGPLKKGFKACGRDLLGLDGAFMKGPYPGQLLTAIGLDANNGIYPLAYAIVEKETTCSWTWFLECLGGDLGMTKESNFTFISDRQKGLAIAMANVFPCAEHRSCLRHIHENMKTKWNGQAYKELLWRCASATTVPYFDRAMEELKQFNKEAFEWLAKIPPHTWSRSHFSGRAKSDILLNNLCECFNDGPLTPSATKLLKIAMDRANNYTVGWNGGEEYEVKGQQGNQCVVNVVNKVCSYRMWELTGIPCAHAIVVNYNMALNGIQVMWKKSQIPTTLTPPKHNTPVGRPGKNRRKTKEEKAQMVKDGKMSRAYKTVTCLKCGNLGHNSRSCKGQKDPGTSTSQRTTNVVAGTRKIPSDASTTPSTVPAKKK